MYNKTFLKAQKISISLKHPSQVCTRREKLYKTLHKQRGLNLDYLQIQLKNISGNRLWSKISDDLITSLVKRGRLRARNIVL